jgi:saccharopine dehydrogenase-like NADP-dependent oxidoreductase
MITTSYVSKPMQQLDKEAKEAGIIILNEIGLDPGIDHMSAMRIIHRIQDNGGTVTGFRSYCCGLPAPEANTNPFGYKFSWSPRGVLLAMKNEGRYMENGKEIVIPPEELFQKFTTITIEGAGEFEAYPNRDSLDYIDKYGIHTTKTMYRGTLRNIGWCPTWKKMIELGLLDLKERDDVAGLTWAGLLKKLVGCSPDADVKIETAKFLKLKEESDIIKRMQWLGLFSEDPLPLQKGSLLDILCALLVKKLAYEEGERDMIILHHEFEAEYPDKKQKITSTLIDFGIPAGDTSMARTVSLPAAIATKLIMEGKIEFKGVHIPTSPAVYNPVLDELEQYNIKFREKTETL